MNLQVKVIRNTFAVLWTDPDDERLVRKVTATRGKQGATYSWEVEPGNWRSTTILGSERVRFSDVRQLSSFVIQKFRTNELDVPIRKTLREG